MTLFALASMAPVGLLAVGVVWGGVWALAAVLYLTLVSLCLDQAIPLVAPDAAEADTFPAADALLAVLAVCHLVALPLAVWAIAGASGLGAGARVALFVGFGMFFGQVMNPAAHELIHRSGRGLFRLGMAVYTSLLFGHHTSAHRLAHHRHAASAEDPNTARGRESFYRFAPRAWAGSFRAGLAAENARRAGGGGGLHPYAIYLGGAVLCLGLAFAIAGVAGVAVWIGLSAYATAQLLLSDYVQHYGLSRARLPDGRLEPISDRHSWNAAQWFSSSVMLNAPRHSDHHAHPARPYPALRLPAPDRAPRLPCSLPAACTIALIPPLWRRMMDPRLAHWQQAA